VFRYLGAGAGILDGMKNVIETKLPCCSRCSTHHSWPCDVCLGCLMEGLGISAPRVALSLKYEAAMRQFHLGQFRAWVHENEGPLLSDSRDLKSIIIKVREQVAKRIAKSCNAEQSATKQLVSNGSHVGNHST